MLAIIGLCLFLIVLQIIVFRLRLIPLDIQDFVIKVCVIGEMRDWNILNQVPQALVNMFKFVDACIFYLAGMKNVVNQF